MVRKMAYSGIFYLIGLFFASFFSFETSLLCSGGILLIALAYFFLMKVKRNYALLCGIFLSVGFLIYGGYGILFCNPVLEKVGSEGIFVGKITDWEDYNGDKSAYILDGKIDGKIPAKIRIYTECFPCKYGDTMRFKGVFSELEDTYVFPEKSYFNSLNIFVGVDEMSYLYVDERENFSFVGEVFRFREYLKERISFVLPGQEGALLTAILCGDKSGISSDNKTLLYRIGIGHMMAVSGVHITILIMLFSQLTGSFIRNAKVKFAVTECVILCFMIFAGLTPSVIRAGILLTFLYMAPIFYRKTDFMSSLGAAAIFLTITSPFSIRDPSFMLSFAGAWAFGCAAPSVISWLEIKNPLLKALVSTTVASVVLMPVSAMFFDEISIIGPLTNLFLIPLCTLALICGILMGITGGVTFLAFPLLTVGGLCCKFVLAVADFFGRMPFTYFSANYEFLQYGLIISIAVIAAVKLIFKKTKYTVFLSACMVVTLIFGGFLYKFIYRNMLEVADFSDAVVVSKGNTAVIVMRSDNSDMAVKKYLQQKGISTIETAVFFHEKTSDVVSFQNDFGLFRVNRIFDNLDNYENSTLEFDGYRIDFGEEDILVSYGEFKASTEDIPENHLLIGNKNGKMKAREIAYGSRQG